MTKALIIEDVWEFEEEEDSSKDVSAHALVAVDGAQIVITPHESDQAVRVVLTRDEFVEIVKLVNSVPHVQADKEG